MLKIIMHGCNGRMGQTIVNLIRESEDKIVVAGVSADGQALNSFPVYTNISECQEDADVIIDFSNPSSLNDLLAYATSHKTPLVIATTGYNDEELKKIREASKIIPIFLSFNMSLGINVLLKLIKESTKLLEGFDIEVVEKHHNKKIDAPSGTAIMIANAIKEVLPNIEYSYGRYGTNTKRKENEVGIHAIRGGTIVGEHNVIYAGHDEIIELKHIAQSKDIFAKGSIAAAKYLVNQNPGYYNMDNMLG